MGVGAINAGSAALEMVRSAVAATSTQQRAQIEVAKKALDVMKVQGQAAVNLIEASDVGQRINVKA
jgi:hypothetical protein